ncbi:hypothetical protein INT47_005922 [Mucor saturninus]|uniref:Galactose oxidase n=1 Tax=Mucor saturninus TaxID=64648 RepID=A0A8H7R6X2_9FUNG|nr:hypothetical protein INT47_005922 [Mucor saturninus]
MRIPSLLVIAASLNLVKAAIPTHRYNGGCAAVAQRLYCFGGTSNQKTTSDHYVFDLSVDFSVEKAIDNWNTVTSTDFQVEPNSLFSIVPLNDSYLVHGGLGYGSSTQFLRNVTTMFNATTESWETINSINETTMVPSREETSTLDPFNRIWTWGGISDNTTSANITEVTYHDEMQVLNMNTLTWSFPDSTNTSLQPSFVRARIAHTETLGRSGKSIFYIGGLQSDDNDQLIAASMSEILEYNIANNTWFLRKSPVNSTVPSSRRLHSATQIPDHDLIFVYGGSATDASKTVTDYSYLLNTTSFEWTAVDILNEGAGPRFGHSAVLYKGKSLFIVFGADNLGNLRNDFFILDIANWQWVQTFKTDGVYPSVSSQSNSAINTGPKSTTTIFSTTLGNESSSANANNQTPIPFNYITTIYLMLGVMVVFLFC